MKIIWLSLAFTSLAYGLTSPILVLELNERESVKQVFTVPQDRLFKLPSRLFVERGIGLGRIVTIAYNKTENDFDFICTYRSKSEVDNLPLEKCIDANEQDLGNVSDTYFQLNQGKKIEINLLNPNGSDLIIHAWYETDEH